jgi:uncharacterized protein DUF4132
VVLKQVREHIDAIAAERGIDPLDLRERAAETHGLAVDGTRRAELSGGWAALIRARSRTAQLSFLDQDGAVRKPPVAVREANADAIATFRADLKSLRATIATERARIDGLLAADRRWDMTRWHELYLDHPVTGDGGTEPPGSLLTYCTSDQVRFFDTTIAGPVPLTAIPPRVFSEAMRDVDLFIAVASVGADPELPDRGEGRLFTEYWHSYGFGALEASAEIRRDVLAALLPRLAIAGHCTLTERFLVVRGDLRTYRIHLRSANILMSPANDALITDESITRQIGWDAE